MILSRASGIWVGLKLVTPVADGTGTVDVHPDRVQPVVPTMEFDGKLFVRCRDQWAELADNKGSMTFKIKLKKK